MQLNSNESMPFFVFYVTFALDLEACLLHAIIQ